MDMKVRMRDVVERHGNEEQQGATILEARLHTLFVDFKSGLPLLRN